jgi:DNA invertase Pin-like site-specific DNA recombinase
MEHRIRAGAYIRVSTTSRFQCHSYDFQVEALKKEIQEINGTVLIAVYADKGISGKATRNRVQFKAMINDALSGELDIIYCKSVSRFARNIMELLTATRELREKGVAVYFETEKINTLDTQSELYLIIAAAVAENELSVFGARNEWAVEDNFKQGKLYYGNGVYGYTIDTDNRTLLVNPPKAAIVKYIFNEYAKGKSAGVIAKELNLTAIPSSKGGLWQDSSILCILENEKYVGDCILRKTYTLKGLKKKNRGAKDKYLIENTHEPIIERELFQRVQEIRANKPNIVFKDKVQREYPFTGLIECGCCGKKYTHKVNNAGTASASDIWGCSTQIKHGRSACNESTSIKDEVLKNLFVEAYNELISSGDSRIVDKTLVIRKEKLLREERELLRLRTKGLISHENYAKELDMVLTEVENVDKELSKMKPQVLKASECTPIEQFDEDKLDKFIQKIVVKNYEVEFVFINSIKVKKPYTNGKHGDIREWINIHGHPSTLRKEAKQNANGSNK